MALIGSPGVHGVERAVRDRSAARLTCRPAVPARPSTAGTRAPQPAPEAPRLLGNRALAKMVQPKLRVGAADDAYEKEADLVAERVMRMAGEGSADPAAAGAAIGSAGERGAAAVGRGFGDAPPAAPARVQRQPAEEEVEEAIVEQDEDGGGLHVQSSSRADSAEPPAAKDTTQLTANALTRGGAPLALPVRRYFERRLGRDLSSVRIHSGEEAIGWNRRLQAQAFTYRSHVWLGEHERPEPSYLLAHELAHVVQQTKPPSLHAQAPQAATAAAANVVQRRGSPSPTARGPVGPAARMAVGSALSLRIVVGPDGSASFTAEVQGAGIATGSGTATNLDPGEYRVRWAEPTMVITRPDGSTVPDTTRFDIATHSRHNTLVRALQEATSSIPLYVLPGPAGGPVGSAAAQAQQIAALPERLRAFLFSERGPPTNPRDYTILLRIADMVGDLTEDELAEYLARSTGSTTAVAEFEAGVRRWLTELRARRAAEQEQESAKAALSQLGSIYDLYRSWSVGVTMWGSVPGFIQAWEALPASALPSEHEGDLTRTYLALRRRLAAQGWANLAAFESAVARFVTAFREHAFYIALDLLGRFEHTLLEEERRYQVSGAMSRLHSALAPAHTTFEQAEEHAASARASYGGSWAPADVMAYYAAGQEYQRRVAHGRSQVRALSGSHPLFAHRDFPVEELGRASSAGETTRIVRAYLTERLANVRDSRLRLAANHELVFQLDVLLANAKGRQGIEDGSIWDKIIRDHTAPSLDSQIRDMMLMTLAVALGVATAGTGSLALAAISLGLGTYQAVEAYREYAFEHDAAGAQLLSEEPSLTWVVLAVIGAGVELGAVAATIRPLRPALRTFQRSGDMIALEAALGGMPTNVKSSILSRARLLGALSGARAGLQRGGIRFRRISDFWPSGQVTEFEAIGRIQGLGGLVVDPSVVQMRGLQTLGGGRVWVSRANISLDHVDDLAGQLVRGGPLHQGRTVHIVSGRHGPGDFLAAKKGFYIQDLTYVQVGNPNVQIHNWAELTEAQLRPLLEGGEEVILAWCVSDETRSVANILVGAFW